MTEQSNATRGFFGQLSVWTGLATASLLSFGYCFEQSKFDHLGIPDTGWLYASDILGAVRGSFIGIAMVGTLWVLLYALIFHGFLPTDARGFAREVFFKEGEIDKVTAAAAKKLGDTIGGSSFGIFMLLGIASITLNHFNLSVPDGSLYQALGLSLIGLLFTLMAFSIWLEVMTRVRSRLFRIFLTASLIAGVLATTGSFAGQYNAAKIMTATSPNIEIQTESGATVQGVLADVLVSGYLIRTRDARRMVLFEHSAVRRIIFLSPPKA